MCFNIRVFPRSCHAQAPNSGYWGLYLSRTGVLQENLKGVSRRVVSSCSQTLRYFEVELAGAHGALPHGPGDALGVLPPGGRGLGARNAWHLGNIYQHHPLVISICFWIHLNAPLYSSSHAVGHSFRAARLLSRVCGVEALGILRGLFPRTGVSLVLCGLLCLRVPPEIRKLQASAKVI